MTQIPYTISRDALTLFIGGIPYNADSGHPNYEKIIQLLMSGDYTEDKLLELVSVRVHLENIIAAHQVQDVKIGTDTVWYKDRPVHSHLSTRMLDIVSKGLDVTPWALFMNKLYANPSRRAVEELYLWLEKSQMPITPEGNFLAYKKVRDDYSSYHLDPNGNKVWNRVGDIVSMERNEVEDDRRLTCAQGLHFCSWTYLPHYYGRQGRVMMLSVNPADVVSIPKDYDDAKGRAWQYKVVGEIDQRLTEFAFSDQPVVDVSSDWLN